MSSPCWSCCPLSSELSEHRSFVVLVVLPALRRVLSALPTRRAGRAANSRLNFPIAVPSWRWSCSPLLRRRFAPYAGTSNPDADRGFCRYLQLLRAARKCLAVPCGKARAGAPKLAGTCGKLARGVIATSDRQVAVLHHKMPIPGWQKVPLGPSKYRRQHRERAPASLCARAACFASGLVSMGSPPRGAGRAAYYPRSSCSPCWSCCRRRSHHPFLVVFFASRRPLFWQNRAPPFPGRFLLYAPFIGGPFSGQIRVPPFRVVFSYKLPS